MDNIHCFGGQTGDGIQRMQLIASHFEKLGIPFEVDGHDGRQSLDSLGMTFDLSSGVRVRAKKDRTWRLFAATKAILRRKRVSGDLIRVWLGHVNYHFLLSRPLMSILSATYKFSLSHLGHRFPMWPEVRREMKLVMALLFTVEKDLSAEVCSEVHVGDASDRGFGFMSTDGTARRVKDEMKYDERWRFIETEGLGIHTPCVGGPNLEEDDDDSGMIGSVVDAGVGCKTQYGLGLKQKSEELEQSGEIQRKRMRLFGPPLPKARVVREVAGIPRISTFWGDVTNWTLIASGPWKKMGDHINIKEARVALMAVRRLCRSVKNLGKRCLILSDSMVTILALSKGRSGSGGLNRICRQAAAYVVGGGLSLHFRHITTDVNPADGPSRKFGEDIGRRIRGGCREEKTDAVPGVETFSKCGSPSVSSTMPKVVECDGRPKAFLELFAGTGRLTEAVRREGMKAFPSFEVSRGREYDLLDPKVQSFVLSLLKSGAVWWVHLGTPCTAWSRARHNIKDFRKARRKEHLAVATALFSHRVMTLCLRRGIWFSLENPFSSRLWEFLPLRGFFKDDRCHFVRFDMCQYGMKYKKSTGLLTNAVSFKQLGRLCCGGHKHEQLKGSTRAKVDGKWMHVNKTSLAGAYPPLLVKHWAQVASHSCPSPGRGAISWRSKNEFLGALQEAADSSLRSGKAPIRGDSEDNQGENRPGEPTVDEAKRFLSEFPVVFGQFTKAEAAKAKEGFAQKDEQKVY